MRLLVTLRVIGSFLVILGQYFIVHVGKDLGIGTHIIADMISMPFFIATKAYDVVVMMTVLLLISTTNFISLP